LDYDEAFVADIVAHPDEEGLRLIYADWLEEQQGEEAAARAELLRLEAELRALPPDDGGRGVVRARLRLLRKAIDPSWLARLDRGPIENCGAPEVLDCPGQWERLRPTEEACRRVCGACRKSVFHCVSAEEARLRRAERERFVLDSRVACHPDELVAPPPLPALIRKPVRDRREPPRARRRVRQGERVTLVGGKYEGEVGVVTSITQRGRVTVRIRRGRGKCEVLRLNEDDLVVE
jgi:uncharacterized protein (TIGR02996 family)